MAIHTRIAVQTGDVFPHGAFVIGEVTADEDYQAKQSGAADAQRRDKESGQRVWNVRVIDADPNARRGSGEVVVKIAADHQPVPPSALPGLPLRPVEFDGLTITPYVDANGNRPRLAYSIRATAMREPKAAKTSQGAA